MPKSPEATMAAYGDLRTDAPVYQPLDRVTVHITGRARGDETCTIRVCDPDQRRYVDATVPLSDNRGTFTFHAGGTLGNHYIYLYWPGDPTVQGEPHHRRYVNFRLEAQTTIATGDRDFDDLYPFTRDHMILGRREYTLPNGDRFVGYISADTWHFDGIWLRDCVYGFPAFAHWDRDVLCIIDPYLAQLGEQGLVPDGIERDGRTWRVGLEVDVEYIAVLGVWWAWRASGDDAFLGRMLPRLERALEALRNDPRRWNREHNLVMRQHSCDTWDYDIDGAGDRGDRRFVIATCDQTGYVQAFAAMAQMHEHLGDAARAEHWRGEADAYRRRAVDLLWDKAGNSKFLHHVHLDTIDHGDFDESQQLAMSNTWAMTRGMASPQQARAIVDEYRRRHEATGDAYPWWSLQPGYPDHLGYWKSDFRKQGGYANGGLMPWVGAELCLGALQCGRERYGVELLRQYADHLRRIGGAHVWYWPDGTPGFRTTNEVPYAGWGMGGWIGALVEGLAGIRDMTGQMRHVELSPRWAAADIRDARVIARYAASKAYFACSMHIDEAARTITLLITGSGDAVTLRLLLPDGWQTGRITIDEVEVEPRVEQVDESHYVCATFSLTALHTLVVRC